MFDFHIFRFPLKNVFNTVGIYIIRDLCVIVLLKTTRIIISLVSLQATHACSERREQDTLAPCRKVGKINEGFFCIMQLIVLLIMVTTLLAWR